MKGSIENGVAGDNDIVSTSTLLPSTFGCDVGKERLQIAHGGTSPNVKEAGRAGDIAEAKSAVGTGMRCDNAAGKLVREVHFETESCSDI